MCASKSKLELLGQGRFLRLLRSETGWEFAERVGDPQIAVIAALTPSRKLLLVEQYRPPVQGAVIELPAGLVGDLPEFAGEAIEQAAARELLEETGYAAGGIKLRIKGPGSAGLCTEQLFFLEATDLEKQGPGGGCNDESITVHEVPLNQLETWLQERTASGTLIDPKILIGLSLLGISLSQEFQIQPGVHAEL